MQLRAEFFFPHAHILPFSDFEPLPLYNHVHVPASSLISQPCLDGVKCCQALVFCL